MKIKELEDLRCRIYEWYRVEVVRSVREWTLEEVVFDLQTDLITHKKKPRWSVNREKAVIRLIEDIEALLPKPLKEEE